MCDNMKVGGQVPVGMQEQPAVDREASAMRPKMIGDQRVPRNPGVVRNEGRQQIERPSTGWRRFTGFFVGLGVGIRGLLGIATLGASELLWAGAKKISSAIYNKATGMESVPQGTDIEMNVPPHGQVRLSSDILPKRIPRGMTVDQLKQRVQDKIDKGYQLLQGIQSDNMGNRRCTVEDMTDIMFYIQVRGEAKQGNFSQGAFNIPDPGQKIRKFLDTCPEAYQRASSHIDGFQSLRGGQHRGIDADGSGRNISELLPYERRTLLYGSLQRSDDLQMPEDRLWLKLESHGCWLSSPSARDSQGPGRTARFHDLGASWGHTFSFLATRGKGSAAGTFKERIPAALKNGFRAIVDTAPPGLKAILTRNNPTEKAKGIRVMYRNCMQALRELEQIRVIDMDPLLQSLRDFISGLRGYGDVDLRIGNEVILTGAELSF